MNCSPANAATRAPAGGRIVAEPRPIEFARVFLLGERKGPAFDCREGFVRAKIENADITATADALAAPGCAERTGQVLDDAQAVPARQRIEIVERHR